MPDVFSEFETRKAKAYPEFDRWRRFLGLGGWGYDNPAAQRVTDAMRAVSTWRSVTNQGAMTYVAATSYEMPNLVVRVVADTLADQVASSAGPEQDAATVAWVVAGLRCAATPFCLGCGACQTVTSPLRPLGRGGE